MATQLNNTPVNTPANVHPSAEQLAAHFNIKPLEKRMEFAMPYGRDVESPEPSVPTGL